MHADDEAMTSATLEERLGQLERRVNDFGLKGQILGSVTPSWSTGIERFLEEPEFWENTYDASQAECARRCIEQNKIAREACSVKKDAAERLSCYEEALATVTLCQARCAA